MSSLSTYESVSPPCCLQRLQLLPHHHWPRPWVYTSAGGRADGQARTGGRSFRRELAVPWHSAMQHRSSVPWMGIACVVQHVTIYIFYINNIKVCVFDKLEICLFNLFYNHYDILKNINFCQQC